MPFTFSHPAIVLPLKYLPKRLVSMTGLIIGSMAPDFEYFIRMKVESIYSHTVMGMLWFDLPLGLILAFLYHNIIRNSLIDNLPFQLKKRLYGFKKFEWTNYFQKNFIVVFLSLLIGISSHILWDSFTHRSGYFVILIPDLSYVTTLFNFQLPFYKILQHLSSLIGGIVVLLCIWKMPVVKLVPKQKIHKYWVIVFLVLLSTLLVKSIVNHGIHFYEVPIICITGTMIGTLIAPIFVKKEF